MTATPACGEIVEKLKAMDFDFGPRWAAGDLPLRLTPAERDTLLALLERQTQRVDVIASVSGHGDVLTRTTDDGIFRVIIGPAAEMPRGTVIGHQEVMRLSKLLTSVAQDLAFGCGLAQFDVPSPPAPEGQ